MASRSIDGPPAPLSADLIERQFASLRGLPEYIRKLERKERAAQKSAEVKARRIARLEEEIQQCVFVNTHDEVTCLSDEYCFRMLCVSG